MSDGFKITDEDVDYVGEALIPTLERISERAVSLPEPEKPYTACRDQNCRQPGKLSRLILRDPVSAEISEARVLLCTLHRGTFEKILASGETFKIRGLEILALNPPTVQL